MSRVPAFALSLLLTLVAPSGLAQDVSAWTQRGNAVFGEPGVFVVVDSLDTQLATVGGQRTVAFVLNAGLLDPAGSTAKSWAQLSKALDAGPTEAIERLLGTRVVIAFPSLGLPMPREWVMATSVSRADAQRVLKGLDAVHRGVLAGAAVFSIERGAYRMCVLKQGGDARLIVLGPGEGGGLFDGAVRSLSQPEGSAWFASGWPAGGGGGVLVRLESGEAASLAYAHTTETGWEGVAIAPSTLPADTPTWSLDAESMIADASLGMVGSMNAESVAGSPLAPFLGLNRATARSVLGEASCRGIVRVSTDAQGQSDVVLALETKPERAAEVDAAMRMLIAVVTGRPVDAPDFAGRFPGATRSAPLSGGFSESIGRLVLGDAPQVRWKMLNREDGIGRLAVRVGQHSARTETLTEALTGLTRAEPGPLVSAGRLEPGPVAGLVERAAGVQRPVLGWADQIESVTWRTRRMGEDRVKASFEIDLRGGG